MRPLREAEAAANAGPGAEAILGKAQAVTIINNESNSGLRAIRRLES